MVSLKQQVVIQMLEKWSRFKQPEYCRRVHKQPPSNHIISQFNTIHKPFSIILLSKLWAPMRSLLFHIQPDMLSLFDFIYLLIYLSSIYSFVHYLFSSYLLSFMHSFSLFHLFIPSLFLSLFPSLFLSLVLCFVSYICLHSFIHCSIFLVAFASTRSAFARLFVCMRVTAQEQLKDFIKFYNGEFY
jgi:hypothetical protein